VANSRIVFQPHTLFLRYIVFLADGHKQLGLLYGINTKVGFHVEIKFQHVLGISGFFGYKVQYLRFHLAA